MLDRQKGDDPDQHTNHIDPGLVDRLATAYAVTDSRQRSMNYDWKWLGTISL